MAWVQIAAATLSGNSLRQTVHSHRASVHQAAKLAAALLWVAGVTAGLAESNGSLLPGLWLTSPTGWLPRTGISFGTLRSVIEYGLYLYIFIVRYFEKRAQSLWAKRKPERSGPKIEWAEEKVTSNYFTVMVRIRCILNNKISTKGTLSSSWKLKTAFGNSMKWNNFTKKIYVEIHRKETFSTEWRWRAAYALV